MRGLVCARAMCPSCVGLLEGPPRFGLVLYYILKRGNYVARWYRERNLQATVCFRVFFSYLFLPSPCVLPKRTSILKIPIPFLQIFRVFAPIRFLLYSLVPLCSRGLNLKVDSSLRGSTTFQFSLLLSCSCFKIYSLAAVR